MITDKPGGGYIASARHRFPITPGLIARRRFLINLIKYALPLVAFVLLALIGLWPEIQATATKARMNVAKISGDVEGGKLIGARYNGIDQNGRPYTITAATARQVTPDRIDMTMPKGDITLENGTWLIITSKDGTFEHRRNQLDLVNNVTLYRDDGTVMQTESATLDLKAGAAAGSQPVHVEAPFGTLDAAGFAVLDKSSIIEFAGPAHLILNGDPH
jgi:lipopolysaccharide export system protein LptC